MKRIFVPIFLGSFLMGYSFLCALFWVKDISLLFSMKSFVLCLIFSLIQATFLTFLAKRKRLGPLGEISVALEKTRHELVGKVEALGHERGEMVAILKSMIEGVLVIDENERLVLLNSACAKMFRCSEETKGRPFWEVLRHRELVDLLKKALKEGGVSEAEISVFMPEEKILRAQVSPIRRTETKRSGVVCVLHDITSIKRLERLRSEFVANVSHELKTPLTSIKGFVETLLDGAIEDGEAAKRFLKIIEEHTQKLERLISELLDLAKLEAEEPELHRKPLDLAKLIEETGRLFADKVRSKRQILELEIPESLPKIHADEERVEQALGNLIDNAIKFTPQEGRITVRAADEKEAIQISVSDTGIGISEDHLPRIFERFYRVDSSRSRDGGGTGLGLSIVKHIAQAHRGEVAVQSRTGQGSIFTLRLPKSSP